MVVLPLAVAVQEGVARLALVTGNGLGTLLRERFPKRIGIPAILLVTAANIVNIAADLGSIAAAVHLLAPVPTTVTVVLVAVLIATAEVAVPYTGHLGCCDGSPFRCSPTPPCSSLSTWTGALSPAICSGRP